MSLQRARELLAEHDEVVAQCDAAWRARGLWDGEQLERLYRDRDARCARILVEAQLEIAEGVRQDVSARLG